MKAKDLKSSILQMAVEGKLVPQDPNDEPASMLLERIREEKQRLIAEGKAKFPKGGESIIYTGSDGSPYEKRVDAKGRVLSEKCIADEVPFEKLPEGWAWARLGSLCDFGKYQNIEYKHVAEGAWNLDLEDIEKDSGIILRKKRKVKGETGSTKHVFAPGMVLYSKLRPYLNKVVVADEGGVCSSEVLPLYFPELNSGYAQLILMEPGFVKYAKECSYGVKMPRLGTNDGKRWLVALPPLAEQRYIVERVNELIPLVEEYGKLEEAREELDAALPDRLRKSVLQMAVQGKLVPQDPADEPASTLLERIRGQRRQLVAEKKMKAPKGGESVIFRGSDGRRYEKSIDAKGRESEPVCIEDEIPFDVPDSWEWARLETVATYIQRGKSPKYSSIEEYPVVAQKCNQWSGFSLEKAKFIDPDTVCKYGNERILQDGDLLWNSTGLGTLGRMAIYDSSKNKYSWAVADSHVTVIRTRENWFDYRFAFAYFAGPSVQSVIEEQASGSTKQKELAQETVKNYLIPIPSLAEQRRIVAQLEAVLPRITKQ